VVIIGALMYIVEAGAGSGFDSIPKSMYWAVVTMTTVGYGDIAPKTSLGSMLAALLMLAGYGIIAVPTGIVTAELVQPPPDSPEMEARVSTEICPECTLEGHLHDALYCRRCGAHLDREDSVDEPEPEPEPEPAVTGPAAAVESAAEREPAVTGEQASPVADVAALVVGEQEPTVTDEQASPVAAEVVKAAEQEPRS
ncbi:MAG: ion channel, partial [Nannocystaceae bacterium]